MKKIILRTIKIILLLAIAFWVFTVEIGTVATGSMIPNINIGESVLYWKLYPINKVEKGDIVVYKPRPDFPVVHRVHEIQYSAEGDKVVRKLRMKGDNNLFVDSTLVDNSTYVGKVFYIIKDSKTNALLKAVSNINMLTRVGIVLIVATLWVLVANYKVQQSKIKQNSKEDSEHKTELIEPEPENKAQVDKTDETKNTDWFDL